jgi:hypothetical protein
MVPLTAKLAGAGLAELFHEPLKPIDAVAPVPSEPFQLALLAVTWAPLWEYVAPQPWTTCWPAAKPQVSVQPLTGSPTLVSTMLPVKPPGHWDETEYWTEQPGAAAAGPGMATSAAVAAIPTVVTMDSRVRVCRCMSHSCRWAWHASDTDQRRMLTLTSTLIQLS